MEWKTYNSLKTKTRQQSSWNENFLIPHAHVNSGMRTFSFQLFFILFCVQSTIAAENTCNGSACCCSTPLGQTTLLKNFLCSARYACTGAAARRAAQNILVPPLFGNCEELLTDALGPPPEGLRTRQFLFLAHLIKFQIILSQISSAQRGWDNFL